MNLAIPPQRVEFSEKQRQEVLDTIDGSLKTGFLTDHTVVEEFETNFSGFTNRKAAIATASGGAALEAAMFALNVRGKEVIVPTNTFAATPFSVIRAGGRVRLADISPDTFALSVESLEASITPETTGVIVVHVGGIISQEITQIKQWCDDRGLWLFEDAAHAHGSEFNGCSPGEFGVGAAYSFFNTKVMTTGEGGAVVTDNEEFANRIRAVRNYGKKEKWVSESAFEGFNGRMSELSAAVGISELVRLPEKLRLRKHVAEKYSELLEQIEMLQSVVPHNGESSWYKYIVLLDPRIGPKRNEIKAKMRERGVGLAGGVYEMPLHLQDVFRIGNQSFPIAEDVCSRHLCLPIYPGLSHEQCMYVVDALREILKCVESE